MRNTKLEGFELPPIPPPPPPPPPPRPEDEEYQEHQEALRLMSQMKARSQSLRDANPVVALFVRFPALKIAVYIFLYGLGTGVFFSLVEGWSLIDGFYFAMVSTCTMIHPFRDPPGHSYALSLHCEGQRVCVPEPSFSTLYAQKASHPGELSNPSKNRPFDSCLGIFLYFRF
jgi:hypothetical protein